MIKQVQFFGKDDQGQIFCQPLLDDGLVKTASSRERSNLHPKISDFVRTVRPTKHGIYVLVNAMGAGEIWGSNINGDFFQESQLVHTPPQWEGLSVTDMRDTARRWVTSKDSYGYPTFYAAHPFKHHVNKDPSRAFGSVELAVWNPKMKRVELVVFLDRERCKRFDAYDIIEKIEAGGFPDVSMGCKVPFDVCSICQHESKTPKDYCDHARSMMNKILPDGRKVFVYNPRPRFFDISFVFIGADKTAKVMAKLASKGRQICLGEYCTIPRLSADVGEHFSKEAAEEPQETAGPPHVDRPTDLDTDYTLYDPTFNNFTRGLSHTELVRKSREVAAPVLDKLYPPADGADHILPLEYGGATKLANEHYIERCSCGAVISQCRCFSPDRKEIITPNGCPDCRGKEKTANDPIKKFIHVQGIPIMLEWLKGQNRKYYSKTDPSKVTYQKLMKADYGYIPATIDADGEQLDVYVGPRKDSDLVFIINQLKNDGTFDERKVMIGYADEEAAKKSYLDHMPKERLGRVTRTTLSIFKKNHLVDARGARKSQSQSHEKTASATCDCHGLGDDCGGSAEEVAHAVFPGVRNSEKSASHRKLSELIKSIPAGPFSKETLPKLERSEREIPTETLNRMGEMDLRHSLSTPAMMGIVLKPHEFQRVMLVRIGEKSLADELDSRGEVFGPSSEIDESLDVSPDRIHHLLKELLQAMGFMGDRSAASASLSRRTERLKERRVDSRKETEKTSSSKEPVLRKLSAAYNGYRRNIVKKAAVIEKYLVSDPQLASECIGGSMAKAFAGGTSKTASSSVLSPDSLAYLTGAYHENRDLHIADPGVRASLAQTGTLAGALS